MFVLNIKLNFKKILLICVALGILLASFVELTSNYSYIATSSSATIDFDVTSDNYISTLEFLHQNIEENIGKTIKVSGFVYTIPELDKNFLVCGRYTIDNNETKIAGFICEYEAKDKLCENEWIEITGKICKGNYNGDIPLIQVEKLEKIIAPANTYVEK